SFLTRRSSDLGKLRALLQSRPGYQRLAMNIVKTLRNTLFRWQQKLLFSLLRTRRIGTDADELQPDLSRPVVYAVLNESLAERLVIDREVQQLGWPSPHLQRLQNDLDWP